MKTAATIFDLPQSTAHIQSRLQSLVNNLLAAVTPNLAGVNTRVDLRMLEECSYADLKAHPQPVWRLSEICRLLFKAGDRLSLQHGVALSNILYAFTCTHNEAWYISYLYRGIGQIGLGLTDLGIKNITSGLAGQEHFPIAPVDRALGYWALTSAAIMNRNLKLAATFAQKWCHAACDGALRHEVARAHIALALLDLVVGETTACGKQPVDDLLREIPAEWENPATYLEAWRAALQSANSVEAQDVSEPYPLFLGINWYRPHQRLLAAEPWANNFALLCAIRRTYCRLEAMAALSVQEIERYADCLAYWELPYPLHDFEMMLKQKAVVENFQYVMSRLLGREILETITQRIPLAPQVVRCEEAIILVIDVRKFSALSEHCQPEENFDFLNPIFKIIYEELESAGGTILEFIGDCVVMAFNVFQNRQACMPEILHHTIQTLHRIHILNAMSFQLGLPDIQIGAGLNKGPAALGYLGGLPRCHLTIMGNTVNLAARIESLSKELPGDVIVSEQCFEGGTPAIWTEPQTVNFSVRDLGVHSLHNIQQPLHLFGLKPLIRFWVDFVPMGFVALPEHGVVYLDTGNSVEPGILDHHHGDCPDHSVCELLLRKPEFVSAHLAGIHPSQWEFRLHHTPDLDCTAALYAACELLGKNPRQALLQALARYVSAIDQGQIPRPENLHDSLLGVLVAHQKLTAQQQGPEFTDARSLEAQLRVIDAAMFLLEVCAEDDFACAFRYRQNWFVKERMLIQQDRNRYAEDLARRGHTYQARVNGLDTPVSGLWLDHPHSIFFKLWARTDPSAPGSTGYQFLAVDWSQSGKNRFVFSVDPDSKTNLKGLGHILEQHETAKRRRLGKERPIQPIRYPSDNSDPWYFGQGHQYTIVDAPWGGSVLTAEEVQDIHASWSGGN